MAELEGRLAEQVLATLALVSKRTETEAPRVIREYPAEPALTLETDRALISRIIAEERRQSSCANCNGINCSQLAHIGKRRRIAINSSTRNGGEFLLEVCPKWQAQQTRIAIYKSGLPYTKATKTWAEYDLDLDNQPAVEMAYAQMQAKRIGLYLYGSKGCGKTQLATLLAKELIAEGQSVVFGNVPSLLNELKATINNPDKNYYEVMDKFKRCDVLIMDDIGKGTISDWNVGILFELIDARETSGKSLIVTSNHSPADLEKLLRIKGEKTTVDSIMSRLRSKCTVLNMGNKDRRGNAS